MVPVGPWKLIWKIVGLEERRPQRVSDGRGLVETVGGKKRYDEGVGEREIGLEG